MPAPIMPRSTWLGSPVTFGVMALLLIAAFYHAVLGLQVVIEDYVHTKAAKIAAVAADEVRLPASWPLTGIVALLMIRFRPARANNMA